MKKTISLILLILFLILMLCNPIVTVKAAASGLALWYQHLLPALLPFAILSDVLISSNGFYLLVRFLHPVLHVFLPCSREGAFPLAAGFLFGFPMGSRITAKMYQKNLISYDEAAIIFIISNNISPVFIISYILHDMLKADSLLLPTLLILYLVPLMYGRICYWRIPSLKEQKESASRLHLDYAVIDAGIMNGFEILLKLGGYIMLFAILTNLINCYIPDAPLLTAPLEITNGIAIIAASSIESFRIKYTLAITLTSFGGICGLAQTFSMVSKDRLPIGRYALVKCILALLSGILAYLIYPLLTLL